MYASLPIARASSGEIASAEDVASGAAGSFFWQLLKLNNKQVASNVLKIVRDGRSMVDFSRQEAVRRLRGSACRLRLGKFPAAIHDFGAWAVEAHGVVPALGDGNAVGHLAVAAAKLDGDRAVGALLAGEAVDGVRIQRVLLVVALRVVDADRPERLHRHILHAELVDRGSVVLLRCHVEIDRILVGISAPARRSAYQV